MNLDGSLGNRDFLLEGGTATYNPFYYSRQMGPIYPIWQRDKEGNIMYDANSGNAIYDWGTNTQMGTRPYAANSNLIGATELDKFQDGTGSMKASTFVKLQLDKHVNFRTTLGGNYYNTNSSSYMNSLVLMGSPFVVFLPMQQGINICLNIHLAAISMKY